MGTPARTLGRHRIRRAAAADTEAVLLDAEDLTEEDRERQQAWRRRKERGGREVRRVLESARLNVFFRVREPRSRVLEPADFTTDARVPNASL
jgi:hypothetical protein